MSTAKTYRCRHAVEAMQWHDTDENREAFFEWFSANYAMFETRGPVVVLPEGDEVLEGEWVVLMDVEFIGMDDEQFRFEYEETP